MSILRSGFGPLLAAHFLSFLNSNFLKNALILLVLYTLPQAAAESMSATVSATFMIPMIFLSGIGGQLADALDRRSLGRWLKACELLAVTIAAFGVILSDFRVVLVGLVFMQVVGALFGPVRSSLLPDLVGKERVPTANALIEAGSFLAMIAGIWIVRIGFSHDGLVRDIVTLAVLIMSALGFAAINFVPRDVVTTKSGNPDLNVFRGTRTALSEVLNSAAVRIPALTLGWAWFVASLVLSTAPSFLKRLGGDVDLITSGMLAYGVSGVIAAQLAARLARAGMIKASLVGGFALLGCAVTVLGVAAGADAGSVTLRTALVAMGSASAAFSFVLVPMASAVQTLSPPDRRARTVGGSNVLNAVAMVCGGYAVSLVQLVGGDLAHIYAATGLCTACIGLFVGMRGFRASAQTS